MIEKYLKNLNNIYSTNIISLRLSQSKSYLKILSILYFVENTNLLVIVDIIESVIKSTYILNDIVLVFYPHVIKAFPKLDIVII